MAGAKFEEAPAGPEHAHDGHLAPAAQALRPGRLFHDELVFEPRDRAETGLAAMLAWRATSPSGRVFRVRAQGVAGSVSVPDGPGEARARFAEDTLVIGPETRVEEVGRYLERAVAAGDSVLVGPVDRLIETNGLSRAMFAVRETAEWCARGGIGFVISADPEGMSNESIRWLTRIHDDAIVAKAGGQA